VGRLNYSGPLEGEFYDILKSLTAFESVGYAENADLSQKPVPLVATGRDTHLEAELARLVHDQATVERWALLSVQSHDMSVYDIVVDRLDVLDMGDRYQHAVLYVAPTPGHAQAMPFDCVSVDDVLGRSYPLYEYTTLCLVMAHAMGVDTVVHMIRIAGARLVCMIGDPLNCDGSPRESDRGAPMRDLAAIGRRHLLEHVTLEHLIGLDNERSAGALSADEWRHLRVARLSDCQWPTANRWSRYESMDDVPAPVKAASGSLLLVGGVTSTYQALKIAQRDWKDFYVVRSHVCIDELGQVARVRTSHIVDALGDPVEKPIDPSTTQSKDFCHTQTRSLYVVVDDDTIDHRQCCYTAHPNQILVAAHPTLTAVSAVPARRLARVAQRPIEDELIFLVNDKTGIEDVRAAFSLCRRHLHVVGTNENVYASIGRHVSRPRTRLFEMARDGVSVGAMSLLATPEYEEHEREPTAPYVAMMMGSLKRGRATRDAVGCTAKDRYLVPVRALRRNTDAFLRNVRVPQRRRLDVVDREVFSPSLLTDEAMVRVTREQLDSEIMWRFWTLVDAHPKGELGRDQEAQFVVQKSATYIQRDRDASLEAMAVHALVMVCRRRCAEWFLEAEKRLAVRLFKNTDDQRDHIDAVRMHIGAVSELPDGSDEVEDEYDLFAKLREVRTYVEDALGK
jgi:hypothetical protein